MSPILPTRATQHLHACPSCPGLFPTRQTLTQHLQDHARLSELATTPETAAVGLPLLAHDYLTTNSPQRTETLEWAEPPEDDHPEIGEVVPFSVTTPTATSQNQETTPRPSASNGQPTAPDSTVLEERIDPNYEPSDEEIREYADWLGMDMTVDRSLVWIAREGLKAPLLAPWKPCRTNDTHEIYYFNFATGESSWDHPCDTTYRQLYENLKSVSTQARSS